MLALVTYDVSVSDKAGRTRLRKVSKVCQNYGQRVQILYLNVLWITRSLQS